MPGPVKSIRICVVTEVGMKNLAWLLVSPLIATPLYAVDLMQVYRDAQSNDPTFAAARATLAAGQEKQPQARAGLLPSLSLEGNTTWNDNDYKYASMPSFNGVLQYNSNGYQLTLSQPLFRWQNWIAYDQSKMQVAQAEANFGLARQDLILRVAQAYFDVLYAQESVAAVKANKQAIAQQLELAKKSFEVGTSTITDTHEAQARFDLANAQEIAAESDLEVKLRALQAIVGQEPGALAQLRKNAELTPPQPSSMNEWVSAAETGSLNVQVQQYNARIAAREVDRQRAGHYPTLDLVANYGESKTFASTAFGLLDTQYQNIGLQINVPLFQGGSVASREREASANRAAAASTLENG